MRFTTESSARRAELARQEFDQFVTGSTNGLLRTAYLVAGDLSEAEDLVQECLLAVAKRWPRVRRMDHPLAYARRVLVNLALDGARRRSRRQLELSDAAASEALPALPPRQRAVLVLRYFEDLSEARVATALGCSIGMSNGWFVAWWPGNHNVTSVEVATGTNTTTQTITTPAVPPCPAGAVCASASGSGSSGGAGGTTRSGSTSFSMGLGSASRRQ